MPKRTILLAGAFAAAIATTALAQTVIVEPDQEVVVREYIAKQPPAQIIVPEGYHAVIGEKVPDTITVSPLDAPGFEKTYEYVVIEGQTVLIDPRTRQVVQILE